MPTGGDGQHRCKIARLLARRLSFAMVLLAPLAQAQTADILALDCGDKDSLVLSIWVDFDKSTVTVQEPSRPGRPLHTYVARISENTIRWKWSDSGETSSAFIDRRTGTFHERIRETGGASESSGPYQCNKSAAPPPAAKF